uniref:TAFII55 protein conserved region domain-containing protein n=1 Tax=Araucaria cunninghamii TaxID=56994 RepID=A0A0D6R8J1_ARACU
MEEQFILRVPPSVAERIDQVLSENPASGEDNSIDISFSEDGRSGTFVIGNHRFPATLLDLPGIVESYKSYDDSALIKTADVGQMIMVREEAQPAPAGPECRDGLTPPMRDARRRRFRRCPDINPDVVSRVEEDLMRIMAGGTAQNVEVEVVEEEASPEEEAEAEEDDQQPSKGPEGSRKEREDNEDAGMKDRDEESESLFESDDDD